MSTVVPWPFPPAPAPAAPDAQARVIAAGVRDSGRMFTADHHGWHYRVQRDHRGHPFVLSDGSLLVLAWPETELRPTGARLLYVPAGSLECVPESAA